MSWSLRSSDRSSSTISSCESGKLAGCKRADLFHSDSSATCSSSKDDVSVNLTLSSEFSKFEIDQSILPNPEFNNKRRTVVVLRDSFNESFGFALQSYVFKRSTMGCMERITYVDYVRDNSAAARAGVRRGDVVVAVNGVSVIGESHSSLVNLMTSQLRMRLVLLFQNIARIISLSARSLQLQYILAEKQRILDRINNEERSILNGSSSANFYTHPSVCPSICSGSSLPTLSFLQGGFMTSRVQLELHPDDPKPGNVLDRNLPLEEHSSFSHIMRVDSHSSIIPQITRL